MGKIYIRKNKMLLAAYGTLRLKQPNFHFIGDEDKYLGTFETEEKYEMFSLGFFPGIIEGGNTSITYDLFEIDNRDWNSICRLEGYNGDNNTSFYYPVDIETPKGIAKIFIINENPDKYRKIESGDWVKFISEKIKCY